MKIASFIHQGVASIGKVFDGDVLDLATLDAALPSDMLSFLSLGEPAIAAARAASKQSGKCYRLKDVTLQAPVANPRKFLAIGFNYHSHIEEIRRVPEMRNFKPPEVPVFFNKQVTCVQAPYGTFQLPKVSTQLDYETELLVVIGQRCRHVSKENAHSVIAGYCVANDVSVRDWQLASPTTTMGKSFDTHGPYGPWITTADELDMAAGFSLKTWVNGELRQDGHTSDMVHSIGRQIEYLSAAFTLEPGDLIVTGTPAGVGVLMEPRRFLKEGDVVRCEISGLGYIEHTVVRE